MAVDAASRFTIENAKVKTFTDFLTNFDTNPLTGYLALVENEESVKQSIRNLVLTERTERFYQAHIGSKINSSLFEPFDPITEDIIRETIKETIKNNEPRAVVLGIDILGDPNHNMLFVTITFSLRNIPERVFDVSLALSRVR